jgi:flagellar hook-length control protein FliK
MAADSMLTLPPLQAPAAAPAAGAPSSAAAHPGAGDGGPGGAGCGPQSAPSGGGGPAAAGGGDGGSNPAGSSSPDKAHSTTPDTSSGDSRRGRAAARAAGTSPASAPKTTKQSAAGTENFAAALAQSLAATPADGTAQAATAAGKASAEPSPASSGKGESSTHPAKDSADDPASTALTLLEHALAGVLLGTSSPPAAPNATAGTGTDTSSQSGPSATRGAAAVGSQLIQALAAEAKGAAPGPTVAHGSPAAAASAPGGGSAAALTAAQLTAGSHPGLQQAKSDPPPMVLGSPVGSSGWTEELGTKLTWMAHQGIESASLQLSPEHLGPLQVSISVHNGQASVWFGAAQPDTRTALQQSLPQLRQLFANQGLTLADTGVSRDSPQGQGRQGSARPAAAVAGAGAVSLDGSAARVAIAGGRGLVDTYA